MAATENRNNTVLAIAGGAGAGALAATLLGGKQIQAAQGSDEEVLKLLREMNEKLADLVNSLSVGYREKGGAKFLNPPSFNSGTFYFQAINTGYQLPGYDIPFGMDLIVQASTTNAGLILVASTGARAKTLATAFPLVAGQNVKLRLPNLDRVWVSCTVVTDTIHWVVEGAKVG